MNRKGTKRHSQPARSNEDLVRRFVDDCRRTPGSKPASPSRRLHRTRRTERTAGSSPVDVDCASQGAALVTRHAIVRATETGARHPACGPHAGGSGGEHIRPQYRAGGQAVPGARISTFASPHDRARFPPLRRAGPAPATPLVFE